MDVNSYRFCTKCKLSKGLLMRRGSSYSKSIYNGLELRSYSSMNRLKCSKSSRMKMTMRLISNIPSNFFNGSHRLWTDVVMDNILFGNAGKREVNFSQSDKAKQGVSITIRNNSNANLKSLKK